MKRFVIIVIALLGMGATVVAQHKLGDIITIGDKQGMVFKVDETGEHGLAFSMQKCEESWLADKEAKYETAAFYEDDGEKNLKKIEEYIKEANQQWDDFPFFKWCKEQGEGWYPPSKDEAMALVDFMTGDGLKYHHKTCKKWSKILEKADGDKLYTGFGQSPYIYYTSTEAEGGLVWALVFNENPGSAISPLRMASGPSGKYKLQPYPKRQPGGKALNLVGNRAIHKF